MATEVQYAGEYELDHVTLTTSSGAIIPIVPLEINLFENIFDHGMSGSVIISDTDNVIDLAPIIGQDYISFKIKTPTLEDEKNQTIDFSKNPFCVYKIGWREDLSINSEVFELHFVSPELLKNLRTRVSKSYNNNIHNIVEDILKGDKTLIDSKKDLFIEKTSGIRKMVVPNLHPYDCIKNLATESISLKHKSPHYLFYETTKGIHFRSLQSLYAQDIKGEYNSGDVGHHGEDIVGRKSDIEQDLKRTIVDEVSSNNDMISNIKGGMLGSKIIVHDIYNKNYKSTEYKYFDDFNKFPRVNYENKTSDNPIYNEVVIDDKDNTVGNFSNARIHLHPTSTTTDYLDAQHYDTSSKTYPYTSNKIQDWLLHRQAKFVELTSGNSIKLYINGNTTVEAGQRVIFHNTQNQNEEAINFHSGVFIIKNLRHIFSQATKKHEIVLTLVKDSLEKSIPVFNSIPEPVNATGKVTTNFYD